MNQEVTGGIRKLDGVVVAALRVGRRGDGVAVGDDEEEIAVLTGRSQLPAAVVPPARSPDGDGATADRLGRVAW